MSFETQDRTPARRAPVFAAALAPMSRARERARGPVRPPLPILVAVLILALTLATEGGCAMTRHRGPRTLGFAGVAVALGGSGLWVAGQQRSDPGPLPNIGLGVVAVGVVAMIVAGGWIAAQVSCQSDPDCEESEECREIPAPPGGIPYKQCMPR